MPGILVNALMGLIIFGKVNGQFLDHDGIEYPTLTPDNNESIEMTKNTRKYGINLTLLVVESGLFQDNQKKYSKKSLQ